MATTKTKKKVLTNITEMQANQALGDYARAFSAKRELEARITQMIADIRSDYSDTLADLDTDLAEADEVITAYAQANPKLFETKKSLELQHGTIGYRTNPPSVVIKKGVKVETVVSLLRNSKLANEFVREKTTYSLDKETIINRRGEEKLMAKLSEYFITVEQTETFFIEPKVEGE